MFIRCVVRRCSPTFTVSSEHLDTLRADGVVLVKGFYPESMVARALASVSEQVDGVARALQRAGRLTSLHADAPVETRLQLIERDCPGASTLLHKNPDLTEPFRRLWAHPPALHAIAEVLGTRNLMAIPNWNLRCKTPDAASNNHATVPFHQDQAYSSEEGTGTLQLTCWIPLVPITLKSGPMEFVVGNTFEKHRVMRHVGCWRNTWYLHIAPEEIEEQEERVFEVMFPGDVLLFDNYVPHRSLPNISDHTRWSCDLRWQDARLPSGCDAPGVILGEGGALLPEGRVDWSASEISHQAGWERVGTGDEAHDAALLTPLVSGPWMDRWEMTNVNEHVRAHRSKAVPPLRRNPRRE